MTNKKTPIPLRVKLGAGAIAGIILFLAIRSLLRGEWFYGITLIVVVPIIVLVLTGRLFEFFGTGPPQ